MQKVIVIGQGYTGRLSIVRSVAEIGCDVTIIALLSHIYYEQNLKKRKPLDAYSKYVGKTLYCENYNDQMLIDILLEHCVDENQKTFIFPDNDFSAAAVDKHRDKLKAHFYIPHIHEKPGAVGEWMDKTKQKALAAQIGLNVVQSKLIHVRKRSFSIPEGINFPCFVKPLVSIVGGKSGLKRCNDKTKLEKHINAFLDNHRFDDVDFMVEDFKAIDREFATLGFSDGKEVIIPGLLQLLHIGHDSHFGVALQGRAFPITGYEDIVEQFKRLVKEIGFVGVFDIDFFESDGKLYFCELNLRFGGSGYAFTKLGVNLPVMMIKSFLGESIDSMNKTITNESIYFNERMAVDDWYAGYMSTEEFNKIREGSAIKFIENEVDPAPQKMLEKEFRIKKVKKTLKRWIGRK